MNPLDYILGAMLIGVITAAVLYGVTCTQTWYYFTQYPSDPWYLKLLVSAVFFSNSIHLALTAYTVYTYLVSNFGDFSVLGKVEWSTFVALLFDGFATVLVQCFLTFRIYKLSNKKYSIAIAILVSVIFAGFVSIVICCIKGLGLTAFAQIGELQQLSIAINAFAAVADIFIAGFLCILLRQARSSFKKTNVMIKKMILFSINTGFFTSICAIMSLVTILGWPNAFVYIAFYLCIGRLYCNSLLATLNARRDLRGDSYDDNSIPLQIQKSTICIQIDTKKEYLVDENSISPGGNLKVNRVV